MGLVLAGDPVKRHVLPHYDVQELAGNLGSDNDHLDPLVSNTSILHRKCQTTVFIRISQATVDGSSKSFKDSWFWGLADSIILNVEGRLNSGRTHASLQQSFCFLHYGTWPKDYQYRKSLCRPWWGRNFPGSMQQRYKKHSITCGCLLTQSGTRPYYESA